MKAAFQVFQNLLEHPVKLGLLALLFAFGSLLAQGTLLDLWNLKMEKRRLHTRYEDSLKANTDLRFKIGEARSSDRFIGHEAREKLDLLQSDELVFIFENAASDEVTVGTPSEAR